MTMLNQVAFEHGGFLPRRPRFEAHDRQGPNHQNETGFLLKISNNDIERALGDKGFSRCLKRCLGCQLHIGRGSYQADIEGPTLVLSSVLSPSYQEPFYFTHPSRLLIRRKEMISSSLSRTFPFNTPFLLLTPTILFFLINF